ncbi:MAG: S9 family peptidase [Saprospiraceae bacterium]|nr:S9 family peptidase [Saprospiraceae bacterium]
MRFKIISILVLACLCGLQAQTPSSSPATQPTKKQLEPADLARWNQIQTSKISNDGTWVAYTLKAEEGDGKLYIWNAANGRTRSFDRGDSPVFSADNQFLAFKIKPHEDSLKAQRRRKIKKEELTKDSLGVLHLGSGSLTKKADVKSFAMPEEWDGWLAYQLEPFKPKEEAKTDTSTVKQDSLKVEKPILPKEKNKKKKEKKEGKDTGSKLVLLQLASQRADTIHFVRDYKLAKDGPRILINTSGTPDSSLLEGVYLFNCALRQLRPLMQQKGDYKQLTFNEKGTQLVYLANLDTTKAQVPPFGLCYWEEGMERAKIIADSTAQYLPKAWRVSENATPVFSKDGSKLYFGVAPPPILQDTSLLEDEIVNVEVWAYTDGRLHTNQKTLLEQERKRSYDVVWHISQNKFVPLSYTDLPEMSYTPDRFGNMAIGLNEQPYLKQISWEGEGRSDVWLVDETTGSRKLITKGLRGNPRLSPDGSYAFWYNEIDSAWFSYSLKTSELRQLTTNSPTPFYDELNDVPDHPSSYGFATWVADSLGNSTNMLIYDRYDIWQIDPTGKNSPINLTNGRVNRTRYRFIRLDQEERYATPGQRLFLHVFDEKTKAEGYALLMLGAGQPIQLVSEAFAYTTAPLKAKDAEKLLFTKENFQTFPDLQYCDFTLQKPIKVSNANPQQGDYQWGSIELYEWTASDGQRLQGLLVKPADFDPKKQYPMIVNFYERSSDELNLHRAPYPHRSSINYAYYASRGYLVFNPDIPYRTGYPGESCFNSVVSGVTSLVDKGFVDKSRIGVQGHSWGGYQVAYLLTKTNIFKCAESGAPVVNMFSAYGGIRWQTGLSRMFQYEHQQSRIGGTIWEYPMRYFENSPLFSMDKVNTPVLIMANDADGHVPWYQGIEYFTALRRLGKPAWMLNYNDEPHWPVKLQNRKDFQLRMSQFFDYYLMGKPMPQWMMRGVPAIEKGIRQGLDDED